MKTAFLFDVDGTLTTTEILPCIASELGISDEMATLTRATMEGHIAFEPSFRLRCLLLGNVPAERVRSIVAAVPVNKAILAFIHSRKKDCFLVTGNLDMWIEPLAKQCGCRLYSSIGVVDSGGLRIEKILKKSDAVADIRAKGYDRIVAMGDGSNDVCMLSAADVKISFGGVHSPAIAAVAVSDYVFHEGSALCKLLEVL